MSPHVLPARVLRRPPPSGGSAGARPRTGRSRGATRRGHVRLALVMLAPTMAVLGLVVVYPLLKAVGLSLTETSLLRPAAGEPVGAANYARLLTDPAFWSALRTTAVWTVGSVAISYLVGLALALALNESFRGRRLVRGLVLIPWVTPGVVVGLLFLYLYNPEAGLVNYVLERLGLVDDYVPWLGRTDTALPATMLANIWNQVPFYMLALLAGLSSLPEELVEAARVDGANGWQRFWHITLPHLKGVTVITTALMTIWNFNSFDLLWSTTQGGPVTATTTLSIFVYRTAFEARALGYAGAIGVAWLVILMVFAIVYIRSMERGAER